MKERNDIMLHYLKKEANITYTENGAVSYHSSENYCLDFFYQAGALRNATEDKMQNAFMLAYNENADLAMKILFYARDIRGGLGERRLFRTCLRWLSKTHADSVSRNVEYIAEFGRYDDLLTLMNTPCEQAVINLIKIQLHKDITTMNLAFEERKDSISLLAKWLPSVNTSSNDTRMRAKKIARGLDMSEAKYRKMLSKLRKEIDILENRLREKDYTFLYGKQPSKAMFKYKKAFIRNDKERYIDFLTRVQNGEAVLNTSSLYPYDIVRAALEMNLMDEERKVLDASWKSLKDYGLNENAIAVVDGSGSMFCCSGTPRPADAALSLGIYFAEHSKGKFANHFITFSEKPQLVELKGKDIVDKVHYATSFNEVANTNIEAVFMLILNTARKYNLPQEELPNTIFMISDMEFDSCANNAGLTNFENAKKMFENSGYQLPNIVFWNVNSRTTQVPVSMHDNGTALISGSSPKIFEMVRMGDLNPMKLMLDIINSERYVKIAA